VLERFAGAKEEEIRRLEEKRQAGTLPPVWTGRRPSLELALREQGPGAVIAEYKRASPSRGGINLTLSPLEAADAYKRGGASGLSVLTEEKFFLGSLDFLFTLEGIGLPMLRKDFILHPLQVVQTAATPASALLLIVCMIPDPARLEGLFRHATELGLETVFEIFNEQELDLARQAGGRLLQVNNRDLSSLEVDLTVSRRLIGRRSGDEVWISASGISTPRQVDHLREIGFDGLLVGTSLMASSDPARFLQDLLGSKGGEG
jgi:indole-3-glycerol phosphate synthase